MTAMPTAAAANSGVLAPGDLPRWSLDDLYASMDAPELARDLEQAGTRAIAFETAAKGQLADIVATKDAGRLAQIVREYEGLSDFLGRIGSYAGLYYYEDTTDPKRAKFFGDVQGRLNDAATHVLFFELELNRIDDASLDALVSSSPALQHYAPWFADIRRDKPYQLADDIERLFHEKSQTGGAAWNRLFDETIAAMRFQINGEELALSAALNLLQDADEGVRKAAAEALGETFAANLRVITLVTNVLAKDKEISDNWRGFKDIADSRHLANRVEPEVVDALVAAVREAYPRLSHRYYKLKAKWLGKDVLQHWDRNAPLPSADNRLIPWSEARETVLSAYGSFSPDMAKIAKRFFDDRWIDAPTRPGKATGAFAHPTVPSAHPYVLLNYQGKTRDVMTLAHELGHGVHQVLAARNGALMAPTPLTLAETASVFGEMLTFKSLLAKAATPAEKKSMLSSKVEDMLNTVIRQIAFYTFERKVHSERRQGELTSDRLNEIWLDIQGESLGPAIVFSPGYETYWAYIGHFIHSPFYVYAYAFGDCLVNSLYARYEQANEGFQEKYFALLSAGGTKHHTELLAPFGLDATDPKFWSLGLSVIEGMIDQLEALEE